MPFAFYVNRAVSGPIRWRNLPDSCRHEVEAAVAKWRSGTPMEGGLNVGGRWVARWCDIRDMWIED